MGINGIGKPGAPGISGINSGESAGPVARPGVETFEVEATGKAGPTTSLERLRSGDLSVDQYLDQKVAGATQHLEGRLSPEQLDFVRNHLRDQLSSDPGLQDLVRTATQQVPKSEE